MTMICPICDHKTAHFADAKVAKCGHCLRSFQFEPMNTESQQQIAQKAANEIEAAFHCDSRDVKRFTAIILSAIERATDSDEIDTSCTHPHPQLGCPDCGAWLQPQRTEQQEWTPERLIAYLDTKAKDGSFKERMQLIANDFNAALTAERQRRCPNCDFYAKAGITLLDAKWLDPECHEGCQSLKFKNQHLSALAAIEQIIKQAKQTAGMNWLVKYLKNPDNFSDALHEHDRDIETRAYAKGAQDQHGEDELVRKPLVDALNLFQSVIKSGESWTPTCQKAYDNALAKVKQ